MAKDIVKTLCNPPLRRRTILKAGLALGALQIASPYVVKSLAEEPVKIGLDDPFTGTYAELGRNEQIGCQLAVTEINAKGGILGRHVELVSEDSTSTDTGTAVQKAHKLIDRDKVNLLLGNVNSAMALALGEVSNQAGILHIVTGGHTDPVTGSDCHWNVFRVCNTTRMETDAVGKLLIDKFGKKWYFITPDYAFGHTLQKGFEANLKKYGGTEVRRRAHPARHDRFLLVFDQGRGGETRRSDRSHRRSGCRQLIEADRSVRPAEEIPHRRRPAGARSARRPAARRPHRHLGIRMVLEPAERAAREGVRRRDPQDQ